MAAAATSEASASRLVREMEPIVTVNDGEFKVNTEAETFSRASMGFLVAFLGSYGSGKTTVLRLLFEFLGRNMFLATNNSEEHTTRGIGAGPTMQLARPLATSTAGSEAAEAKAASAPPASAPRVTFLDPQGIDMCGEAKLDMALSRTLATVCGALVLTSTGKFSETELEAVRNFGTSHAFQNIGKGKPMRPDLVVLYRSKRKPAPGETISQTILRRLGDDVQALFNEVKVLDMPTIPQLEELEVPAGEPFPEDVNTALAQECIQSLVSTIATFAKSSQENPAYTPLSGQALREAMVEYTDPKYNSSEAILSSKQDILVRNYVEGMKNKNFETIFREQIEGSLLQNVFAVGTTTEEIEATVQSKLSELIEVPWRGQLEEMMNPGLISIAQDAVHGIIQQWQNSVCADIASKQHEQTGIFQQAVQSLEESARSAVQQTSDSHGLKTALQALLASFDSAPTQHPDKQARRVQLVETFNSHLELCWQKEKAAHAAAKSAAQSTVCSEQHILLNNFQANFGTHNVGNHVRTYSLGTAPEVQHVFTDLGNVREARITANTSAGQAQLVVSILGNQVSQQLLGNLGGRKYHGTRSTYTPATKELKIEVGCNGWGKGGRGLQNYFNTVQFHFTSNGLFGHPELQSFRKAKPQISA
eukprot:m.141553 g.141553  ORF g.141553 m.141553 type:complete len:648 (+) comp14040_c0_seq2:168-2111(+)